MGAHESGSVPRPALSQFGGVNASFGSGRGQSQLPAALRLVLLAAGAVIALIGLAVGLVLLYVGSRLQFVLFDILLLQDDTVAPSWRRHGHHTWRWLGVKVVFGIALGLLLLPLLVPAIIGFIHLIQSGAFTTAQGKTFSFPAMRAAVVCAAEMFFVTVLFIVGFRVFTTLALPGLALEDLSFGTVFRRAWWLFRENAQPVLLYALLMPLLLLGLALLQLLCLGLALAVPAVPIGLAGWALWTVLHGSAVGILVFGTVAAVTAVLFLASAVCAYLLAAGTFITFNEAWALYFVGGRYPLLGQYLEGIPAEPLTVREEPRLGSGISAPAHRRRPAVWARSTQAAP